jgi:Fic family protein
MQISDFISGSFEQQSQYKSFSPAKINHHWLVNDEQLSVALSAADHCLGSLTAYSDLVPNVDFFIKMHVKKEATSSNRIEGTQTNIEDALQKIENINPEKRDDWQEVQNYVEAMNYAIAELPALPLSNRLLRQTHAILLKGVRGTHKQPGNFRTSQNWIGGASINDAVFIPPHPSEVAHLMSDLELFLHNETIQVPALIRIAIAHYQFETIHPFCDGNGRIGRLLVPLFLVNNGMLSKPTLYLSDFFARNKTLYYDNLTNVRLKNDLRQWLLFFLEGIRQTAENAVKTLKMIVTLKENIETTRLIQLGQRQKQAHKFMDLLYRTPIVDSGDLVEKLDLSSATAMRMLKDFIKLGILRETTGYKRNRIFMFSEYIKLFE